MLKILFILTFFIVSSHAQTKDVTLLLPWKHQFQFAGYYMAQEKGFYKKDGLHVVIKEMDFNRDNAQEIALEHYEFALGDSSVILDKINRYKNLKLLAVIYQSSPLILLAKKHLSKSLDNLKNKQILIDKENGANTSIYAMLHSHNITTVQVSNSNFNMQSFIEGSIDVRSAYISNEPFILKKRGIPYTIYDPKKYGYDFYSDILFTSQEMIRKDPRSVQAFYRASLQGWKYAFEHIDESVALIQKYYNTQHKSTEALTYEAKILKNLSIKDGVPLGYINPIRLKEITNTYRLLGFVQNQKDIDFNTFIYKIKLQDQESTTFKNMILKYYHTNHLYIITLIIVILLISILFIYLFYRLRTMVAKKSKELDKNYEIYNKNISASKTDLAGNITYVTDAFCKRTGYKRKELIGKTHSLLRDIKTHPNSFYKDLWLTIKSGHSWKGEIHNIVRDGTAYWAETIISPIFNKHNKIIGYDSIREDVTVKKTLIEFNEGLEKAVQLQTQEIHRNREFLDILFNINPNITYVLQNGIIHRVNNAFLEFTGFKTLESFLLKHKCICELFINPEIKTPHIECLTLKKIVMKKEKQEHIFSLRTKHFSVSEKEYHLLTLEDITALETKAVTDKLTGIYNRVKIDDTLSQNSDYYHAHGENFSLIIFDIDHFKDVNDTYGHQVGDDILKAVVSVIQNNTRTTDIFGRWGGEEFVLICPNIDAKSAFFLADIIRDKISKHHFPRVKNLSISAGISDIQMSQDIKTLVKNADTALYKAKHNGRNRVEI